MEKRKEAVEAAKAAMKAEIQKRKDALKTKLRSATKTKLAESLRKAAGEDSEKKKRLVAKLLDATEKKLSTSDIPQKTRLILEAVRDSLKEISAELKK